MPCISFPELLLTFEVRGTTEYRSSASLVSRPLSNSSKRSYIEQQYNVCMVHSLKWRKLMSIAFSEPCPLHKGIRFSGLGLE